MLSPSTDIDGYSSDYEPAAAFKAAQAPPAAFKAAPAPPAATKAAPAPPATQAGSSDDGYVPSPSAYQLYTCRYMPYPPPYTPADSDCD